MNPKLEQQTTNKLPTTLASEQLIQSLAIQVGFDACGICPAEVLTKEAEHLHSWLKKEYHGEMGYMERNLGMRVNPRILVPNSKTVISVLLNYYHGNPEISITPPKISRYAISHDYHKVLKDKLHLLLELIRKEFGKVEGRVFVDSAPVFEKALAVRSGLGWIGKNSLLINSKLGSYAFIGELIIDLAVESNSDYSTNRCGTCTRCIDSCPTRAIVSPGVIDSRKCISYLTIEKKTELTEMESNLLSGWCFGCDICQEVCPWNSKATITECNELKPKQDIIDITPFDLKSLQKDDFERIFGDTPLSRTGWEKINFNQKTY